MNWLFELQLTRENDDQDVEVQLIRYAESLGFKLIFAGTRASEVAASQTEAAA